jgi:thiamine-phosphate pyrophosphorylase
MKSSTQYPVLSVQKKEKKLPRLYTIIDVGMSEDQESVPQIMDFAGELLKGGATLIQYRNKRGNSREILSHARELRRAIGERMTLIMNDRADLCMAGGCDGVHLGQQDLSVEGARRMLGASFFVGISTHNLKQIQAADQAGVDYIAVGPVFSTRTKTNPEPVVGLELIRAARKATRKQIVAIGGITRSNCHSVIEAGADSVAVIGDLQHEPRKSVEEFLRLLV